MLFPDLSGPPRSSQITMAAGGTEETPTIATATVSTSSRLRPMILASMFLASPSELDFTPALSASTYGSERMMPGSNSEPSLSLRPLLLGKDGSRMSPSVAEVPLARRRQKGGTISSNTGWPIINTPRMAGDGGGAAPAAFERLQPRLNEAV